MLKDFSQHTLVLTSIGRRNSRTMAGRFSKKQSRTEEPVHIVHIQGTIGSTAQIGRTAALEQAVSKHPNWQLVAQQCGDFTRAKRMRLWVQF